MEETYIAQTETTLTPPAEEPKKKLPKWVFIIAAIVVILIIGALTFVLSQKNVISSIQSVINSSKTNPAISPSPSDNKSTSNWKTLNSPYGKFSLKYPPDEKLMATNSSTTTLQCPQSGCSNSYNIFNFTVTKSNISSVENYLASINTSNPNLHPYIVDYKIVTINSISAVETLTPAPTGSNTGPTVSVFIVINGQGYIYSYTYIDPNLNSVTSLSQLPDPNPNILPTLTIGNQITPGSNTISSWKTYTSTSFGIKLQYPPTWFISGALTSNSCVNFSDGSDPSPAHSKTVINLCSYSQPVLTDTPNSSTSKQITVNGIKGLSVIQTSNWGSGTRAFFPNPKGGSNGLGILFGDINTFNLMVSTFMFTN